MADPIMVGLGAGAVLGLGGLAHDIYSQSVSRRQAAEYNRWSQSYAERQYQAQQSAQLFNQGIADRNLAMQDKQFAQNLAWQKYIQTHGMRMRVADLKAAGINPAVAASVAPVSGPTVGYSPVSGTSGVASGGAGYASPPVSGFREHSGVIRDSILAMYARHLSNRAMMYDVRASDSMLDREYRAMRDVTPKPFRSRLPHSLRLLPF